MANFFCHNYMNVAIKLSQDSQSKLQVANGTAPAWGAAILAAHWKRAPCPYLRNTVVPNAARKRRKDEVGRTPSEMRTSSMV